MMFKFLSCTFLFIVKVIYMFIKINFLSFLMDTFQGFFYHYKINIFFLYDYVYFIRLHKIDFNTHFDFKIL